MDLVFVDNIFCNVIFFNKISFYLLTALTLTFHTFIGASASPRPFALPNAFRVITLSRHNFSLFTAS